MCYLCYLCIVYVLFIFCFGCCLSCCLCVFVLFNAVYVLYIMLFMCYLFVLLLFVLLFMCCLYAHVVPEPGNRTNSGASTEVLEIAAGGGDKGGVASGGADSEVDYLQGDDSEISSAFSGTYVRTWCWWEEFGSGHRCLVLSILPGYVVGCTGIRGVQVWQFCTSHLKDKVLCTKKKHKETGGFNKRHATVIYLTM